ncbi:sensor histidine kinase [Reichenbachiella versicolor]|uniref:sensor histidine kinase n=1 Tax=Reichenbachiella versicolor TaxID=1821036 RepID=UPI000D6E18B3|nr:ATP-binding protein [Reichenbachiella versicolor]
MKKDNLIRSYTLAVILIIIALIIGQFLVQDTIGVNKNDSRLVKLSQRQSTISEQLSKNALLINTKRIAASERNFNLVKKRIKSHLTEFEKIQRALKKGDPTYGITKVQNSEDILLLLDEAEIPYKEILNASKELLKVSFDDPIEIKNENISQAIASIIGQERHFSRVMSEIADTFEEETHERKAGSSFAGYFITASIIGILLLQAAFIFRPSINLAYKNFMTANEAFMKLKKSEEGLRKSAEKQLEVNEKLIMSQRALEQRNKKLKLSEQQILKSSRKQIEVNEKLIRVQDELRKAYEKVKYSEERMRGIAEEQLEATEKLMITENQLKQALEHERSSKDELHNTLENLKSTQSQLVQSEKMASLGQLTAGIAHEINNPINFVYNGIDTLKVSLDDLMEIILKYDSLDAAENLAEARREIEDLKEELGYEDLVGDVKELVTDIKKGAVRTIEIVKGLRVFSRLDEEEMKPANMNDALDATLILLKNKTKNIVEIKKFYDNDLKEINCFPGQLNQVFMNILSNAIQAMPEEKKDKEIQLYTESQEQHVLIKIKDNGKGMSEQVKRRIFEPFFTTKPVGIGTGLGMSISFGIIEKHGGNIFVNSEEGKGTEFSILIPKHLADKPTAPDAQGSKQQA